MNRLVYLFELDSVRKSSFFAMEGVIETEGVNRLFHEIIYNGNSVAISMNQLTDSQFFYQAITDDFAYFQLLRLFECGALRVSLYGDLHTASQYVQRAIDKCLSSTNNAFIFSNLPVTSEEKVLLETIQQSLRYSDLMQLRSIKNTCCADEKKRLEYIIRFVEMILKLSIAELGCIPAKKEKSQTFESILFKCIEFLETYQFNDSKTASEIQQAIIELKQRSHHILEGRNNRSVWLKNDESLPLLSNKAIDLIHLAYNYTVEDSINGVYKSYQNNASFEEDLIQRLTAPHPFMKTRTVSQNKWKRAVRFAEYRIHQSFVSNIQQPNPIQEQRRWKMLVIKKAFIALLWALVYMSVFFAVEWSMGWIETGFSITYDNPLISSIINIALFSILSAQLSFVFNKLNHNQDMPDLIECGKDVLNRLFDCICIFIGGNV